MKTTTQAFLLAAALAVTSPAVPQAAYAQQSSTRPTTMQAQQQVAARYDIRNLRREMGLPEGTGPFVTVPVRVKPNPAVNQYKTYEITIDAGLLQVGKLTADEIKEAEAKLGRALTPQERELSRITRETVAFIQQFNIEIYMTPEEMKRHIDMYRNDDPAKLRMIRDSFRADITKREANTSVIVATTTHLIDYHGMEQIGVTIRNGETVRLLKAVVEAKEACKRELMKSPRAENNVQNKAESAPAAQAG